MKNHKNKNYAAKPQKLRFRDDQAPEKEDELGERLRKQWRGGMRPKSAKLVARAQKIAAACEGEKPPAVVQALMKESVKAQYREARIADRGKRGGRGSGKTGRSKLCL